MSAAGIILPWSWADGRAITASSEASSELEVENLLNQQPSEPWRTASSGTHTADGDFGQARACDTLVLWPHNLGTGDTVQLELANEPTFDSGDADYVTHSWAGRYTMAPWGQQLHDDSYTAPCGARRCSGATGTVTRAAGYIEIGRLMIGEAWQPAAKNMEFGLDIGWVDPSLLRRAQGGQTRSLSRPRYRAGTLTWRWLAKEDGVRAWDDIVYTIGGRGTVLVAPYPDELTTTYGRQKTVLCRITNISRPRHDSQKRWSGTMSIEEAL